MATIVTKNSSTASAVPTTSDLVQGELAVNVTDKRIFTENASTQIVELGTNPSSITTATATVTGTLTANGTFASSNAVLTGGTVNGIVIGGTTPQAITGTTVTASTGFVGGLTGNVTGNLTGNVTGNVAGNLTGNVTGNVTASSGTTTLNDLVVNGTADFTNTKLTNVVTPTVGTDAANKSYVDDTVAAVIDSAPAALDTLNELAAALGDDANFAGTVTTALATKLPLAGGTMTGAIAMGTAKITGLGDPTSAQDAATKTYVDTADALKLSLTGGTMSGAIAMGTNKITAVGDPTLAQDAATKAYTDSILGSATSAATSAAAAATSASNAATSASNAATSATSASNSATSASGSAGAASASASSAATSESNALTSEANAAASESAAATSETNAAASESAASTSETNAASSASSASSSASSASTSASNSASSASSASTSATNAANSATAASGSASAAATSASNAATTYDNFDDRYLGQKASDPSVDNDGDALLTGALYFNTTSDAMKVYTGAAWVAVAPVATSVTVSQISDYTGTATELNYTDGVTSSIQTQLDAKAPLASPTFTGTVTATAFTGDGSSLTGVDSLPSQTGNSGKYLTTDGTDASWGTVAAGDGYWKLISTTSPSGASTVSIEDFSTNYKTFKIVFKLTSSSSSFTIMKTELKVSGSYRTSSYKHIGHVLNDANAGTYTEGSSGSASYIPMVQGSFVNSGQPLYGEIIFSDPNDLVLHAIKTDFFSVDASANPYRYIGVGHYNGITDATMTGVRLSFNSGTMTGDILFFGLIA